MKAQMKEFSGKLGLKHGLFGLLKILAIAMAAATAGLGVMAEWTPCYAAQSWSSRSASSSGSESSYGYSAGISPYSPGSNNIALDLGQIFLVGDLSKYADAIGAQLHYNYGVSNLFAFDASLGYSGHSDGDFSMTSAVAGIRMNMSWYDKVIPYATFGLGFYRPSHQLRGGAATDSGTAGGGNAQPLAGNVTPSTSVSAILFGVHLGPGIDLEVSRNLFFGAALTYHNLFGATKRLSGGGEFGVGGSYISFLLHTGIAI